METVLEVEPLPGTRKTVSAWHIPLVFWNPRRLFAKVEDVCAYRFSLLVLLVMITLIGWATVQTGLIDLEVDRRVERGIATLEEQQYDVVERSELNRRIEEQREAGEFLHLMTRIQVIVAAPLATLASILLVSSVLYGVVALSGKKPEWHTLMTICVYAGFAEVAGMLVRLGLMLRHGALEVDTSAALLTRMISLDNDPDGKIADVLSNVLTGIEPFHIWFWLLVGLGLSVTSQLRRWQLWLTCSLMWLMAAGLRIGIAFASASAPGGA